MFYVLATFGEFDLFDPRARCRLENHTSYEDACKRLKQKWKEFKRYHSCYYSVYSQSMIYYIIQMDLNGKGHIVTLGRIKDKRMKENGAFEILRRMLP